jgi:hypothetical protein
MAALGGPYTPDKLHFFMPITCQQWFEHHILSFKPPYHDGNNEVISDGSEANLWVPSEFCVGYSSCELFLDMLSRASDWGERLNSTYSKYPEVWSENIVTLADQRPSTATAFVSTWIEVPYHYLPLSVDLDRLYELCLRCLSTYD